MRIWWCQEHEASADGPDVWNCLREGAGSCRMVPMRLIPDNAKEGELIWANEVTFDRRIYLDDGTQLDEGRYMFVALDGETP